MANIRSKKRMSNEELVTAIKKEISAGAKTSLELSRRLGVGKSLFYSRGIDVYPLLEEAGVTGIKGKRVFDKESLLEKLTSYLLELKGFPSLEKLKKDTGISNQVLLTHDISIYELAEELGLKRITESKIWIKYSKENTKEILLDKYAKYILEVGRPVERSEMASHLGFCQAYFGRRCPSKDVKELHERLGFPLRPDPEKIRKLCESTILEKNRYMTLFQLQELTGLGRVTLENILGSITEFNRRLGYNGNLRGFENSICEFLSKMGLKIVREKCFSDLYRIKGSPLRFDFYLPDIKTLVEADGPQHVRHNCIYHTEQLRLNDELKNQYCIDKQLHLVRIPYVNVVTTKSMIEACKNTILESYITKLIEGDKC